MSTAYTKENLRKRASWIRDDLDRRVARDGPDCIQPDDVLTLHELFLGLQDAEVSISVLRYSRIHTAVLLVAGKATRWPKKLIDRCDEIIVAWTKRFGKLSEIRPRLFKPDGRLYGVCTARQLTRDALVKLWEKQDPNYLSPTRGMKYGSLGFKPGDWWINGMFAFHAGIIDLNSTNGGICADKAGAYAVVLRGNDEFDSHSIDSFRYRCSPNDHGRYRMTSADFKSRYPIRVLRLHTVHSAWAPESGIRFDGMYNVVGWTIKPVDPTENDGATLGWEIEFQRDRGSWDQVTQDSILKHPTAEETDDYMEYKRVRRETLHQVREGIQSRISVNISNSSSVISIIPETPAITFESPPMSPKSELPSLAVDYSTRRGSIFPGPREEASPARMTFSKPPPSPRATTTYIPEPANEPGPQTRSLTVVQNPRRPPSCNNAEARAKNPHGKASGKKLSVPSQQPEKGGQSSIKDLAAASPSISRDAKGSIAKSFTRMFSDGTHDSDVPESPFCTVSPGYGVDGASSFPFNRAPGFSTIALTSPLALPPIDTPFGGGSLSSDSQPVLKPVFWAKHGPENASAQHEQAWPSQPLRDSEQTTQTLLDMRKSLQRQRRDRAVYEAFDRQGYAADPRLLLAALMGVWDSCSEPGYPDMVLEDRVPPTPPRSSLSIHEPPSGPIASAPDDDYMLSIPVGGIDAGKFIVQQAGDLPTNSYVDDDDGGRSGKLALLLEASSAHEIGTVLREMSISSATSTEDTAKHQSMRLVGRGASSGTSGDGDGLDTVTGYEEGSWRSMPRRKSLSAFETHMPKWTRCDADTGGATRPVRPSILSFFAVSNRRVLEESVAETVDETVDAAVDGAVDKGALVEEESERNADEHKRGEKMQDRADGLFKNVFWGGPL